MNSDLSSGIRYAIYYTPPENHALTRAAAAWLGRNAFSEASVAQTTVGTSDFALTAEPRRYGFHATIKAPFRLKAAYEVTDLDQAIERLVCTSAPCPIGPLRISTLGDFFALVPSSPTPALGELAARVVVEMDRFRAPMEEEERQRRLRTSLDEVEAANMAQWGYPYVLERFRFHMTLTGPVRPEFQEAVWKRLTDTFAPLLDEDFRLDALSLFSQESPKADFVVRSRFLLQAKARKVMA
ncbi:hypothetical protein GCM10010869_05340 [Mesorhizobium tianshanense]|uniref:Putative phosphonate metabolism protein n=1 Tax=Mesorhizobium tianshanense TaxID=39844 RepID=A0A562NMG7_9HYPH|nr:DUF1045 domain-containing protein [Mesorhizobium tianshanense]TWI33181.1 putative phosphonate metabolism protein [Mesorhizobium tianshanense]GLS34946.1 hypothetical protein GCM10010869_05340 [Mesorhizobium tianshanense]